MRKCRSPITNHIKGIVTGKKCCDAPQKRFNTCEEMKVLLDTMHQAKENGAENGTAVQRRIIKCKGYIDYVGG
jgi:hypothetical protein